MYYQCASNRGDNSLSDQQSGLSTCTKYAVLARHAEQQEHVCCLMPAYHPCGDVLNVTLNTDVRDCSKNKTLYVIVSLYDMLICSTITHLFDPTVAHGSCSEPRAVIELRL